MNLEPSSENTYFFAGGSVQNRSGLYTQVPPGQPVQDLRIVHGRYQFKIEGAPVSCMGPWHFILDTPSNRELWLANQLRIKQRDDLSREIALAADSIKTLQSQL